MKDRIGLPAALVETDRERFLYFPVLPATLPTYRINQDARA